MKKQIREYLLKQPLLFSLFTSFLVFFLPFHSGAEQKSDYEIQAALDKLVKRAIHLTEDTVDANNMSGTGLNPNLRISGPSKHTKYAV